MTTYLSESRVVENLEAEGGIAPTPEVIPPSPIAIRKLRGKYDSDGNLSFEGTAISGTWRSTDDGVDSFLSFVTANRDAESGETGNLPAVIGTGASALPTNPISHYYEGYGIAFRTNTEDQHTAGQPNVFIVDNALARRDVVLENVIHTGWGDYAYLAATCVRIEPYSEENMVSYNFELHILNDGMLNFYLWKSGTAMPGSPTLSYGSSHQLLAEGLYWGVSLSPTAEECQAIWTSLNLSNMDAGHAAHYYMMNTLDMPSEFKVTVRGWGDRLNDPGVYGIELWVYNYSNAEWEKKDEHFYGPGSIYECILETDTLTKSVYSGPDSYCRLFVQSSYMSDYPSGIDARIYIDQPILEAWSDNQVHVGGCGDVYIQDTGGLTEDYFDIMGNDTKEWLLPTNGSIVGDLVRPIMWIKDIELLDAVGNPTGIFLVPITDWTFNVHISNLRFSTREKNFLLFAAAGNNIRVSYYTVPNILTAQEYAEESDRNNVAYDLLVKACVPYENFIAVEITGNTDSSAIRNGYMFWLHNTHHESISESTIEEALQEIEGVSNANVTLVRCIKHKKSGETDDVTASTHSLDSVEMEQFITVADAAHIGVIFV